MPTTGKLRGDSVVAAAVALALNGVLAWQFQSLLSQRRVPANDDAASLQVVWIAPAPRRAAAVATQPKHAAKARPTAVNDQPQGTRAQPEVVRPELSADPAPTRAMSAVYLHQARQWAAQLPDDSPPADPFANRRVALAEQSPGRFRPRQTSTADAVAKLGKLFGGDGYTTDDCGAIRERIVGLVVGGDADAVQQDLDYARRFCR